MMTVIVTACASFGPAVSEAKTGVILLPTNSPANEWRREYVVRRHCRRPGIHRNNGVLCTWAGMSVEKTTSVAKIVPRLQRAWSWFRRLQRCSVKSYDRRGLRLQLKVRMLKAEATEVMLYGCITWSPSKSHYDRLWQVHHSLLLRFLGLRKKKGELTTRLSRHAPRTFEVTVHTRRILRAGFVARME